MKRLLARYRRSLPVRALLRGGRAIVEGAENLDYDAETNGELRLIQVLARTLEVREVLDVGANVGDWTAMAREHFPAARVHAFEILPSTFERLKARWGADGQVHLQPFGLSDAEETVELKVFPDESRITTMTDYPHALRSERVRARTLRGDDYLAAENITAVDLLKIDTEGAEPRVLKGLEDALTARRVQVIQFEYGRANILTRFLLRDFHELFEKLGYRVGKIYPTHIAFRDYDLSHEDFIGPNFVAVNKERTDLLKALA